MIHYIREQLSQRCTGQKIYSTVESIQRTARHQYTHYRKPRTGHDISVVGMHHPKLQGEYYISERWLRNG